MLAKVLINRTMRCVIIHSNFILKLMQVRLLWIRAVHWKGKSSKSFPCFKFQWKLIFCHSWHCYCISNLLQPSEHNTYADIEAAYKCLEEKYGAKQEEIILYGQSVGSGPTLDLAARLPRLRAVVLHSPILSGLRVMYPVKRTYWFDIYKVLYCLSLTWVILPYFI